MRRHVNIFNKIIVMIILLLIPIVILHAYSNQVSKEVVRQEIMESNRSRLSFFVSQLDTTVEQFSTVAFMLMEDPDVIKFQDRLNTSSLFNQVQTMESLQSKIHLQSNVRNWANDIVLYFPQMDEAIYSDQLHSYDRDYFNSHLLSNQWSYRHMNWNGREEDRFVWHTVTPLHLRQDITKANLVIEVNFPTRNITNMLAQFQQGGIGATFLYHPDGEPIADKDADIRRIARVAEQLHTEQLGTSGNIQMTVANQKYLLSYQESEQLAGWYLIDYKPLDHIFLPIRRTGTLFFVSTTLLCLMSFLAAFLLYRNVQRPIFHLTRSLQQMKAGDYSVRLNMKTNNEFSFLIQRFNAMVEQIQELIERVLAERIRVRESHLKLLQSQINPHFLYNSFAFIQNMAHLRKYEPIIAMTQNLSGYYRNTTRVENQWVSLGEEIAIVTQYLTIQQMQLHRFRYSIAIPPTLMDMKVPKLFLQPIVENAVVHGIESQLSEGQIKLSAKENEKAYVFTVEDSGPGLSPEQIRMLALKIVAPLSEEVGCGLWNVHQRCLYKYGEGSGVSFDISDLGGLLVRITMVKPSQDNDVV
ncbi:sensor histidine kinase [Paenibacillus sp. IB182496]|uniref:Sensor histidine kinase n=1 Tax=Paenibacillus sabuli TaxID=2772509 RepID=A0A927GUV4_9BACL|nr:histidine kinase [Paenibacillus sabuli]MBD2848102.1 sensor histidine kinase [Paenibacillus sabuli]